MKRKKIALTSGLLLASATPIVAAVSCSGQGLEPWVYLVLDGHDHTEKDKSFNEQSFDGINDYLAYLDVEGTNTLNQESALVRPPTATTETAFKSLYASIPRGSIIVAPGFNQQDALEKANEELKDKKVIYLDGSINGKSNIASVDFNIHEVAYISGYALALYASTDTGYNALKNANGTSTPSDQSTKVSISAYIGSIITPVLGFFNGFQYGINDALNYLDANKDNLDGTEFTGNFSHYTNVEFTVLSGSKDSHVSGGYRSGDGIQITTNLRNAGVDVIMPVAGPQTADTLSAFSGKVIGVDSDQAKLYATQSNRFMFSIMKDLRLATTNMLKQLNGDTSIGYPGLGKTTVGTIDNGLIKISNDTQTISNYYNQILAAETPYTQELVARAKAIEPKNDGWFLEYDSNWYTSS